MYKTGVSEIISKGQSSISSTKKLSEKKKILKIGLAFSVQKVNNLPITKYDKKIKLHIWDTAGQEKFLSIVKCFSITHAPKATAVIHVTSFCV